MLCRSQENCENAARFLNYFSCGIKERVLVPQFKLFFGGQTFICQAKSVLVEIDNIISFTPSFK